MFFLFPLLLAGGLFAAAKIFQNFQATANRGNGAPIPSSGDALSLLNFAPFTLRTGLPTAIAYLAPAGIPEGIIRDILGGPGGLGTLNTVVRTRARVPIPSIAQAGPTVFADIWTVRCTQCGPPVGTPPQTFTPASVLSTILQRRGLPTASANVAPERQLTTILYDNAVSFMNGRTKAEVIPIGASQAG